MPRRIGRTIEKWPELKNSRYLQRKPVPKSDPTRFSVMVARLADDDKGEYAKLIAALLAEFEGVQTFKLDRTIDMKNAGENWRDRA